MDFQKIRAVTFDAGGTLIEPSPSVGQIYAEVAAELGFGKICSETLNKQFAVAWKRKESFDYSRGAWSNLVSESFKDLLVVPSKLFDALYERFTEPSVWRIYEDVQPTLADLQERGYRLGVISNWDDRLEPLLKRLRLSSYFDVVILSANAGVTKPSRGIFQQATYALQFPPHSVLHVGDSVEEDLGGATNAGFSALLLDRGQSRPAANSISTLTDLLKILK